MLDISNLVAGYGGGTVLHGVSFSIKDGERVAVLGRNGAGKTTLLKTIIGLLPPRGGAILWQGRRIDGKPPYEVARAGIGIVPQGREIFADLTVVENLRLGTSDATAPEEAYRWFPALREKSSLHAGGLSGGQQQQLALARSLVMRPKLLLLDEPSEGIQPSIVQDIARVLLQQADATGMGILLVEQNIELALSIAERVLLLDDGEVAEDVSTAALRRDRSLLERHMAL